MRYEQISAAITRVLAITANVRGIVGTEKFAALRLHLPMVRMFSGMLCHSCSSSPDGYSPLGDMGGRELKRNVKLATDKLGLSPWLQRLHPQAIRPAVRPASANC